MSEFKKEADRAADQVIAALLLCNHDYSEKKAEISKVFENSLLPGAWQASTNFDDVPNINFIDQDEFDQRFDEKDCTVYAVGHYLQIEGIDYEMQQSLTLK